MMVITDLDGTLTGPDGVVSDRNLATFRALGDRGVVRVVATGRSLNGVRHVLGADFPIDYAVFSSGAGVHDWNAGRTLSAHNLAGPDVFEIVGVLRAHAVDFMIHRPIPDNHEFFYCETGAENPDFVHRRTRSAAICRPWDGRALLDGACELLVIDPAPHSAVLYDKLRAALPAFSVIRATSPLDHRSVWIEIFPPAVSKALGCAWLATRLAIGVDRVLAVGNDYNDVDLLHWAGTAFLVGNAPEELRRVFPSVAANGDGGVSQAVDRWLAARP